MSENIINREAIEQAAVSSVGSKIFASNISIGGVPTQVISSAFRMSVPQFMQDYEGEDGYFKLEERYRAFDAHTSNCFFNFDTATAVDDYAVYTFSASSEWLQLKKLETPVPSFVALSVFRELITLLQNYKNSPLNRRKYSPLLFICKESVYVKFDEDDKVSVRLLPTRYEKDSQYSGIPREVFSGKGDISSDIFMAAYLYLELRYPNGENFREDEYTRFDLIAERCISPFIGRRCTLEELLELLAVEAASEDKPHNEKKGTDSDTIESGSTSYHFHSDFDVPKDEGIPPRPKKKIAFFEKLRQKKDRALKKADKIKKGFDKVNDRFDDITSTEQGDAQEND